MVFQGQMIGIGFGIAAVLLVVIVIVVIIALRASKSHDGAGRRTERWPSDSRPNIKPRSTVQIESLHFVIMLLTTLPFYLYGGNVLYGRTLFSRPDELVAFILRASFSVLIVEIVFNWIPCVVFHFRNWRAAGWYIPFSGISFAYLTYFVLPPQYHEGEAFYGMGLVWIICSILLHFVFKKLGWYQKESS